MKKAVFLLLTFLVLTFGVNAQSASKGVFENYVGYQLVRLNPDVVQPTFRFDSTTDTHGVNLATTYYVSEVTGVTAEVGANFDKEGRNSSLVTAMGGLTFKANRAGKVQPFVRGLVGTSYVNVEGAIASRSINKSDFGFAYSLGGGLDVKLGKRFGLRLIQVDYLSTQNYSEHQNNVRVGAGITF